MLLFNSVTVETEPQDRTRGLVPVVLENQVKDLEEEKATDPLIGRVNILGRFLSFVLKQYCSVSCVFLVSMNHLLQQMGLLMAYSIL